MEAPFLIVGWKEWVQLPNLNLPAIKAKIDTGAATSSIHAYEIEYFRKLNKTYARFFLHPIQRNKKISVACTAEIIDQRGVKSSSGQTEYRPVIRTNLQIGNFVWEVELNLTNRDSMGMRMLIGREALRNRALVNAGSRFLHGNLTNLNIKKLYHL